MDFSEFFSGPIYTFSWGSLLSVAGMRGTSTAMSTMLTCTMRDDGNTKKTGKGIVRHPMTSFKFLAPEVLP